jgi:hypothetical protein
MYSLFEQYCSRPHCWHLLGALSPQWQPALGTQQAQSVRLESNGHLQPVLSCVHKSTWPANISEANDQNSLHECKRNLKVNKLYLHAPTCTLLQSISQLYARLYKLYSLLKGKSKLVNKEIREDFIKND